MDFYVGVYLGVYAPPNGMTGWLASASEEVNKEAKIDLFTERAYF